jgi:hypothetical protein
VIIVQLLRDLNVSTINRFQIFFLFCKTRFSIKIIALKFIVLFSNFLRMSRNNNYQSIQDIPTSIPSSAKDLLRNQQKDIVCTDCGGISAAKVQQLLSTLEGTTQLFHPTSSTKSKNIRPKKINRSISVKKKKSSARNNSQKTSVQRKMKKTKQGKLNMNKSRSKSKINKKKLSSKKK